METTASSTGLVAGWACFLLTALGSSALAGALLRLTVRWIAGFMPRYWRCALAFFGVTVAMREAGGLARTVGNRVWHPSEPAPGFFVDSILMFAAIVLTPLVLAGSIRWLVRRPDGTAVGYGRSLAIAVTYHVIALALLACAWLLLYFTMPEAFNYRRAGAPQRRRVTTGRMPFARSGDDAMPQHGGHWKPRPGSRCPARRTCARPAHPPRMHDAAHQAGARCPVAERAP